MIVWKWTTELAIIVVLLVLALLSFIFLNHLVAPPKVLFGRSLTAIGPDLFPLLVIGLLALLCAAFLYWRIKNPEDIEADIETIVGVKRGAAFFALMLFYSLTMEPFGFLISSAISMAAISLLVGNRSILQILALSTVGPVVLYILATRALAVSLPELSAIEFAYARVLGF